MIDKMANVCKTFACIIFVHSYGGGDEMQDKKRIAIVDCCDHRFSRVIDTWLEEPTVGEKSVIHGFDVIVRNIFPVGHCSHPYELDVIFMHSDNENLFSCLVDCVGAKGWHENEGACNGVKKIRD